MHFLEDDPRGQRILYLTENAVGLSEIAEMTGIVASTLGVWLKRGQMLEPDVRLSCGSTIPEPGP